MKNEGIPNTLKAAVLAGALSAAGCVPEEKNQIAEGNAPLPDTIENTQTVSLDTERNAPKLVSDTALDKQIRFTETKLPDAEGKIVVPDTQKQQALIADIEQVLTAPSTAVPVEAKANTLETVKVAIDTNQLEEYFKTIIKNAIVKNNAEAKAAGIEKEQKITIEDVNISSVGDSLAYNVILKGHKGYKGFITITITADGSIMESGNGLVLSGPRVGAKFDWVAALAVPEINRVFPTLMSSFEAAVSADHEGKKVVKSHVTKTGIEVELEGGK